LCTLWQPKHLNKKYSRITSTLIKEYLHLTALQPDTTKLVPQVIAAIGKTLRDCQVKFSFGMIKVDCCNDKTKVYALMIGYQV